MQFPARDDPSLRSGRFMQEASSGEGASFSTRLDIDPRASNTSFQFSLTGNITDLVTPARYHLSSHNPRVLRERYLLKAGTYSPIDGSPFIPNPDDEAYEGLVLNVDDLIVDSGSQAHLKVKMEDEEEVHGL
ncbi:hypothetical protein L218DRAFT_1008491 [Marasmius fiardii PR-910]|nr:hypothetical protein L218DRAFT_1008491 [Marasmius fiardii PR-910]